ncbi:uncharacterized protein [Malus domestica]|uniref:uncharacterized protein n=1 Tax=Malus domestica TaxID=3750 RepID=UPI0039766648
MAYALLVIQVGFTAATSSGEAKHWHEAMDDEMLLLKKNKNWELLELPKGRKAIGFKWVYAKKDVIDDASPVRFKARLVAKGYAQKEGIYYNEIFSPVVKHSSICILLALVAQFDLENDGEIDKFSIGYVDSDFASDLDKRRSTIGYVFTMAKGSICWRSILQPTVALSTTEVEYMSMADAIKEVIWTLGLIEDLGVIQHKLDVYCDSQRAIYLAKY